jgi:membrane-associated phospholipid phosphatase
MIAINIVKNIGHYGSNILLIATILQLIINPIVLLLYIIGYLLNLQLNRILKNTIKDTEPIDNISHKYRMPSGHSQCTIYSVVFIYFILFHSPYSRIEKKWVKHIIFLFYLSIYLNTSFSCVFYNYHTLNQVVVGSIIGGIIGWLVFYITRYNRCDNISAIYKS